MALIETHLALFSFIKFSLDVYTILFKKLCTDCNKNGLNKLSSKTYNLKKFIEYVKMKHVTNNIIKPYYEKE